MIYIEPTPYIVGLIKAITSTSKDQIDVIFLTENKSQDWNMAFDTKWKILSGKMLDKVQAIYKIFTKSRYDVVHTAGWNEPFCLLVIFIAKIFQIPVAIESDTPIPPCITYWKKAFKRMLYPSLFKMVNLFLPGGIRQSKYLEYYGVPAKKIISAQMTVDVAHMQKCLQSYSLDDRKNFRHQYRIPDDHIVFMYAGRLVRHKGIFDLIDAFKKLSHDKTTLLIAGDGELHQQIEDIVNQDGKIRYTGRLHDDALYKVYFASDVFVLPSHFEPWGLVVNEAMAAGKPVIVTDRVGCIDDLVEDGETGLIVKSNSVDKLLDAMVKMLNPELRIKMSQAALHKIAGWTLENEANNICRAWDYLLQSYPDLGG